ncbi:MAG TPA: bifunctional serine/threonine-protein kinase/formylglycine-generating enzyme family protein [Pirellulaceae bacterium]|jgi:serine/threonine protein kinase/formylglycine-generating enzyme required for sulfatase activity
MPEAPLDQVEALFHEAAELSPDQRSRFLDAACRGDVNLRAEVESLLASDAQSACSDEWLNSPVVRQSADLASFSDEKLPGEMPALPTHIGHYRILRRLGEGGMGIVYEAEQDNPRRTVALKVIRPGLLSQSLVQRFAQEANILGRLHHVGIAEVYEAGLAEDGRPYFAMEYVSGTRIDEYVKSRVSDARARLNQFARVCDAVQHAHERGIVHRDLKPTNIIVDDTGQPKVLDFGVARAQGADWQLADGYTQTGQLIGTPQYMSPEQIAGNPRAVDQRSDVYALGLMLFEILSDQRPYQLEFLSLTEVARVVQEHEPLRLGTLRKAFRGDIETIVGKAIEKDKSRRYESAGELAADIRRFLADEPIVARPPTAVYRMHKFVRRYKALVVAFCAVTASLVLGLIGVLWMYVGAQHEADKAKRARDFLVSILRVSETDDRGGSVPARQILNDAEKRIPREFADQPQLQAELLQVTADVKRGMAKRAPRAMILEARGVVRMKSGADDERPAAANTLLFLNDRLSLASDAAVQIVFLSDMHKERLAPGTNVTIGLSSSEPATAVLERDTRIPLTFVRVPKGKFFRPWVQLSRQKNVWTEIQNDFEISTHEVTQGQWQALIKSNPSSFSREGKNWQDVADVSDEELKLFPVEEVSWHDIREFLRKLNERERGRGYLYRLPTEAEWEYACRCAATSEQECSYRFYFAEPTNKLSSDQANFNGNAPFGGAPDGKYLRRPARVGFYSPNRLGLCDMHGNVWEWCAGAVPGRTDQPVRGGGWFEIGEKCQASTSSRGQPTYTHYDLGFRLVRVAMP